MGIEKAFATLLSEIETAFQESINQSNIAAQAGDFDTVDIEVERQKNLVSIRNQLQILQEVWQDVVGEHKPTGDDTADKTRTDRPLTKSDTYRHIQENVSRVLEQASLRISDVLRNFDVGIRRRKDQGRAENVAPASQAQTDMEIIESVDESQTKNATEPPRKDLSIFANYKHNTYEATLLSNEIVCYKGTEYSPSGAAEAITHTRVNGWLFWRYIDEQGREHFIDNLRK